MRSYFRLSMVVGVSALIGLLPVGREISAQEPLVQTETRLNRQDLLQAMSLTSRAFRAAAEKIRPALVTIESYGGVGTRAGRIGGIRKQGEGNTTGVMISPDGYIITSTFNFIQQPPVISVIPSDGQRRFAKLLGRDDTRKICLLKIEGVDGMPVPEMVDVKDVVVGQWARFAGRGLRRFQSGHVDGDRECQKPNRWTSDSNRCEHQSGQLRRTARGYRGPYDWDLRAHESAVAGDRCGSRMV